MGRYLLDTDVLIDYSKGRELATSRLQQMADGGDKLAVCGVCEAEFFAGIEPPDRANWRQVFSSLTYWDIFPAAAQRAGDLRYDFARQGQTLSIADCLLAAVAIEQGVVLVTNNSLHYPMAGVHVLGLR